MSDSKYLARLANDPEFAVGEIVRLRGERDRLVEALRELHDDVNRPDVRWSTDPTFPWATVVKVEDLLAELAGEKP